MRKTISKALAIFMICLLCFVDIGCIDKDKVSKNISPSTESSEAAAGKDYTYTKKDYPLERNGIKLHLDCMKADGVETKDNILLVHGLTYSSHEFDVDYEDYSLVRYLCRNGYAVWRMDVAGYGQSQEVTNGFMPDSRYAAEDVKAAVDEILKETKSSNIDLLGWSWGTVTTSLAVKDCSEKIDKYVLYAPILSGIGKSAVNEAFHQNNWENAASDFQMKADGSFDYEITEEAVISTYCSNCWKYDKEKSPNGGRKDLCVEESKELIDLASISNKTLLICGDKDPYMNMQLVNESLDKLPNDSTLTIIKGAAHCMMIEKPFYHQFQVAVIEFLLK